MSANQPDRQSETRNDPSFVAPTISLPKGGGAIRGIGEKFGTNPVTGTASMSVPIATSPGRSGFGPQLALSYDSGMGNGSFGFGWNLSVPSITRKTDKGMPQYADSDESDIFLMAGTEDLVPVLNPDGSRFEDTDTAEGHVVHRYRPRIEGLFARIERWTRRNNGDIHWRSISRDNVLTIYGKDEDSRITGPLPDSTPRIFTWLISETRDDKGNAVIYEYKPEDGVNVDLHQAHERNRGGLDDARRTANRYIKHIRYGNRLPMLDNEGRRPRFLSQDMLQQAGWMFEVVFDYGEHHAESPKPTDSGDWSYRDDPFSSYRSGFEVRTCRLCQRVLMFHHFPNEAGVGNDCLVRSTSFTYSHEQDPAGTRNPVHTFLEAVTQSGYQRDGDGYLGRSMPPVEFEYSRPIVQNTVQDVDLESLENLPVGLDGAVYQWTDLHGEGIPGILSEHDGTWYYKRNLSPINLTLNNGTPHAEARFAPVEVIAVKPNLTVAGGQAQFMDLAGDGQPDLVVLDGPMPGLYEHDGDEGWQGFRPFTDHLNRNTRDPNVRFIDLDGDGHADVLISEDTALVWHRSLAEKGFGPALRIPHVLDEEKGPRLVFADGTDSIYLADLSGDGLTDLVRIRNGEISYWPNLGYGRFGAKITMDHSPYFDHPEQFEQMRVRLADIDGTGTTDIIYLHRDSVRLYFNQSGNSWSEPQALNAFPMVDNLSTVIAIDLLGNGTACLVWSSPLPGGVGRQMRYVDLMGGTKPHLIVLSRNNLGAETRIHYAPSTRFYVQDKRDGNPWITRLPFPVHVVERVETFDHISGNHFVSRYAYHHGYFAGEEREFRGFGMVEQWDTEEFASFTVDGSHPEATNLDAASHVPPVLTRTWFHTGLYLGHQHVSDVFAGMLDNRDRGEYYREPAWRDNDAEARKHLLPDTVMPPGLSIEEEREACRSLKGMLLRQEVYALDETGTDDYPFGHPYTILEQNFSISVLQRRGTNRQAIFLTHAREAITYNYERNPSDPRISHTLTLEVDRYGNVLKSLAIGYGRRVASADPAFTSDDHARQRRSLMTYTENTFTHDIDDRAQYPDDYRAPLPAEVQTYELTGIQPEGNAIRFSVDEWVRDNFALISSAMTIPYEQTADNVTRQKRLIEHIRSVYRRNDLTALLRIGEIQTLAHSGESYKLALTPGLLARVFKRKQAGQPDEDLLPDPAPLLEGTGGDEGGYVAMDGNWWIPSGRTYFHPGANVTNPVITAAAEVSAAHQSFYLPRKVTDSFHQSSVVQYDAHNLLIAETRDALDNVVGATNDYRVLQPAMVTDANRNRTRIAFDTLGMIVATAVMGKVGENLGDLMEDVEVNPPLADVQAFIADPQTYAGSLLGKASSRVVYDLERYQRIGQPPLAATLARETHFHDPGGDQTRIQVSFSYSDGLGREVQQKVQAEPGNAPQRENHDALPAGDIRAGELVRDGQGSLVQVSTTRRWVGSGRTVFNNKGKPVKQYEPFFSATHLYEPEHEMTDTGVSPVLFYDPVERVVATLHPNHTYEKVAFDAWQQTTWDVNDTVAANDTQTGDPRTDPDIAGYVREYFKAQPATWLTWFAQRGDNQLGPVERDAAQKAAAHAGTPAVAHLDVLGRIFLSLADNGPDPDQPAQHLLFATRMELDIEGNQLSVIDAKDRVVMRNTFDIQGNLLCLTSMEAGERWMLSDTMGNPIRAWDSRHFIRRMAYDELRRSTGLYVIKNGIERLAQRTEYGEERGVNSNHRTRVDQVFDSAGVVTSVAYDFKGNLQESRRHLLSSYRQEVNWLTNPVANEGSFTTVTTYDALNRPITVTTPDKSVYHASFNEANLLSAVNVNLRGGPATPLVTSVSYDAKGQRKHISFGNGTASTYEYDPITFRLVHLSTIRPSGSGAHVSPIFATSTMVQNLHHTFDPAGNVTRIEDSALKSVFYNGQQVNPVSNYAYDPLYRLTASRGREHIGQTTFDLTSPRGTYRNFPFTEHLAHPHNLQAMRAYAEHYSYDEVGNILSVRHVTNGSGWTRRYEYGDDSLLEAGKKNNRLTMTTLGNDINRHDSYAYDAHGNLISMDHLRTLIWNFEDQLQQVNLGGGGTAYYIYDAAGQRVRKVIESESGTRRKDHFYLGDYEVYREYRGGGMTVQMETETLHVMDDRQRIALVTTQTVVDGNLINRPTPVQRYQISTHHGSTSIELNMDSAIISFEEFHPYGTSAFRTGSNAAEVSLKRHRYVGKERDEESGLDFFGARYYAPWIGRWTACDPAGIVDSVNLYAFTRNNPVSFVDPSGLWTWKGVWQETKNAAKAGAGGVYGASKTVAQGVIGVGQATYYSTSKLLHESTGSNIWKEQAETYDRGIEAIARTFEGGVGNAVKNYVKSRGDKFVNAVEAGDHFGAGEAFGEVSMELYLAARTAKDSTPRISVSPAPALATTSNRVISSGLSVAVTGPRDVVPLAMAMGSISNESTKEGSASKEVAKESTSGKRSPATSGRPSLLQQATKAGVREVIDEGPIEVFAHGTTAVSAKELIKTQGSNLSTNAGNFGGKFFTVPNIEVAEVFATRSATKVSQQPSVVGIALPQAVVARLKAQRLLTPTPIDNPPPGVSSGAQQWTFEPAALETLKNEGFFFPVR